MTTRTPARGFTLLELSIVVTIFAVMVAGVVAGVTQESRRTKQDSLKAKMDTIEVALNDFIKNNYRIPCPADGTVVPTSASLGTEYGSAGSCTGNWSTGNTYGGVVPVRALGLPDDALYDPWGGRFTYIVDKRATATNAFRNYSALSTALGSITPLDSDGSTARTATGIYAIAVVISHGPNGHGSYQLVGGSTRKSSGSSNTNELINCHCTSAAAAGASTSTVVQAPAGFLSNHSGDQTYYFDDTVRYYLRSNFLAGADVITEKSSGGTGPGAFSFGYAVSR